MTSDRTLQQSGEFDLGVIGLGVMGRNLALNARDHGFRVVGWTRSESTRDEVAKADDLDTAVDIESLVQSLAPPRRVLLMIPAGAPVDAVMHVLEPLLDAGDIVIDGGNSHFEDTRRREAAWREKGLRFFGMGISGGEEGARNGPSLMPGGDAEAYTELQPLLESIAAVTKAGPCVTHVGPDGAGHYVKMVHNGIEYADMQLIAETYDLLRRTAGFDAPRLAEIFARWDGGQLESFLIEITAQIFKVRDADGGPLVEAVLDRAGAKGTGRWTVESALALGVPVPTIFAALSGRALSAQKPLRMELAKELGEPHRDSYEPINPSTLESALLLSKLIAYAQGFALLREASKEYDWSLRFSELARIWQGGCIIRAALLDDVRHAFELDAELEHLLLAPFAAHLVERHEAALRRTVEIGAERGIPLPAFGASLAYLDSLRTERLPQNLVQAQRDAFGAHTYRRQDDPDGDARHTDWLS